MNEQINSRRLACVLLLVMGCGSNDDGAVDAPQVRQDRVGVGTFSCNSIDLSDAPVVFENALATKVPPATGGPVVNGTYFLTALETHTGDGSATGNTGKTLQQAVVLSVTGNTGTIQWVESTGHGSPTAYNVSLDIQDSHIAVTQTCPACAPGNGCMTGAAISFSASDSSFTAYVPSGQGSSYPRVQTFTLVEPAEAKVSNGSLSPREISP